jgi:hypothetical protein
MPAYPPKKILTMLDVAITSDHEDEADAFFKKARQAMREAGLRVADLNSTPDEIVAERDRALDLVKQYCARLDRAEAENKRLRAKGNGSATVGGLAARLWQDAGTINTVSRKSAEWVLDVIARDLFALKAKDLDFVQSCTRWARSFTAGQEAWLLDIVRRAAKATGESPPP